MRTHVAVCEWNPPDEMDPHGAWSVHVGDIPGANTQVRRLDQVGESIREAIELMNSETTDSYRLELRWHVPGEAGELADEALRLREAADAAPEAAARAAKALRSEGFTVRDIGMMIGTSHQRAQQLVA